MTDLEKLNARLNTITAAKDAVQHAVTVDRKLSTERHNSGHLTRALTELAAIESHLISLIKRLEKE